MFFLFLFTVVALIIKAVEAQTEKSCFYQKYPLKKVFAFFFLKKGRIGPGFLVVALMIKAVEAQTDVGGN